MSEREPRFTAVELNRSTQILNMLRPFDTDGPKGPQAEPILTIHRHTDGYVTFHRKNSESWEELFAIRADKLDSLFPTFRRELERDSYFSVNSFYRDGGDSRKWPALGRPYRRQDALRYLCACYADLDCYKVGLDVGQVMGMVIAAQDRRIVPPASLISRSGRGVWLLWLLRDSRNPDLPQRAWPEKIALYCHLQRALHERLAPLGSDAQARDLARVTRVPGSIHSGTGEYVAYWLQADQHGKGFLYSLEDLARFFDLGQLVTLEPSKRRGWQALHRLRLRQFDALRALRGGFREGCRNRALLLYTHLLRKNGFSDGVILDKAKCFADECHPPLTEREGLDAIKSGTDGKFRRIADRTISDWLDITAEEATGLETWQPASRFLPTRPPDNPTVSRKDGPESRRSAIRHAVGELRRVPSVREMSRLLAARGVLASHVTVASDYLSLRLTSDNEAARRARRHAKKRQIAIREVCC